ncbi:MAG TPA: amino acid permease [Acidimicrobiales bacterium]|nr:amino acid permease [Acidimicrobiales bacterium]
MSSPQVVDGSGAPADAPSPGQPAEYEPPRPTSSKPTVPLPPDSLGYRVKRKLLGKPMHSEQLEHERLGKPTALAVFASDNLSSSAYATEEILHVLVPAVGIGAFALVMPITVAMLVVLGLLIISYRETIKEYPSAGGAYLVTRDNFGIVPAQLAGAALLIGYILTVAVSVAAGSAALTSTVTSLAPYRVPLSLFFIVLIAFGNLRGVRESGRIFAAPTFFFMANMGLLLGYGIYTYLAGDLPVLGEHVEGMVPFGDEGTGLLVGASAFVLAKAFASGGSAVTGVEAISNGVPAFHKPEWRNARQTLVVMGSGLAVMFLGLSFLASKIKVAPFEDGTPTVLAQIGEAVYGHSGLGETLSNVLNVATMLILVLAANTGFADFPRLANLQAGDSFLPRQLTKRGHRLVFSNGIIALAGAAAVLVVLTGAEVTKLIPLYAISVFTGFTLSQAGMTKHHLRKREKGFVRGIIANGVGAVLSGAIVLIVIITRFADAWVILPLMPAVVLILLRLNGQYERERVALQTDVPAAATAPILRRHVVLVFVDRLDLAAARAIQYARTLTPDELRAVHFVVDDEAGERLADEWRRLGLSRVRLELVACPDRRLTHAAVELVALELSDGETEVSVLLPDRKYNGLWHRILHDRTAESILTEVSKLPHANVTTVPFHFDAWLSDETIEIVPPAVRGKLTTKAKPATDRPPVHDIDTITPIGDVRWRDLVRVKGSVRSMRVAPQRDVPTLECVVDDGTGTLLAVFLGRRELAGVKVGSRLEVVGTAGVHQNRLAILNPSYVLLSGSATH